MKTVAEDAKLAAVVRAWTAEARLGQDVHPEDDVLVAYHDGALGLDEAERLRDHLALCPSCARRGLDLAVFSQPELLAADELSGEDSTGQATQLGSPALARPDLATPKTAGPRSFWAPPGFAYAAAAVFFLLSVGLSLKLASVQAELKPRADVQLVGLRPLGISERGSVSPVEKIAAPDRPLVLTLNRADAGGFDAYRVEVFEYGNDRKAIWSVDVSGPGPEGVFAVLVPSHMLRVARYRVRLSGLKDVQPVQLEEYALGIEFSPTKHHDD